MKTTFTVVLVVFGENEVGAGVVNYEVVYVEAGSSSEAARSAEDYGAIQYGQEYEDVDVVAVFRGEQDTVPMESYADPTNDPFLESDGSRACSS